MPGLTDPVEVGGLRVPNRLYRAPLLECAGNGPDAAETLVRELEPAAAAGAGMVHQGATIVRGEGGCAAPNMTSVADPEFVAGLSAVPEAVHEHESTVFAQLAHGGLRSMETWHAEYRAEHPDLRQLAVSDPPAQLRLLDHVGFLDYDARVMTTGEVEALAADFGRAAGYCVDAGYDGIHLSGANMSIVQQFLSPFFNRREDRFADGVRFLERVHDEVRARVDDEVPLVTKVPAETAAPPGVVRRHLTRDDGVRIAERLATVGYDALVPVECSVVWDMSIVRGEYPEQAWSDDRFQSGYAAAFGSRWRAKLVAALNRAESLWYDFDPGWNETFCRRVRDRVDVPVLMEGGIRSREQIDRLLGDACDLVGLGRPFYAEPRLPVRLLAGDGRVACENCNNCAVPQVTGADGVCRTPAVLRERGRLEKEGAYERRSDASAGDEDGNEDDGGSERAE